MGTASFKPPLNGGLRILLSGFPPFVMPRAPSLELLRRGNHGGREGACCTSPLWTLSQEAEAVKSFMLRYCKKSQEENRGWSQRRRAKQVFKRWEQKWCWNQGKSWNPGAEAPLWPSKRSWNVEFTGVRSRKLESGQDDLFIMLAENSDPAALWLLQRGCPLNGHFILFEMNRNHNPSLERFMDLISLC